MKIEKMSLAGIKNVLSRAEMKKIMAGSGSGNPGGGAGGCSPSLDYNATFYCCAADGYVLGTVVNQCCHNTPQVEGLCTFSWPSWDHITGPC